MTGVIRFPISRESFTLVHVFTFSDVKRLTLDVIASTVFSYDTDVFNEDDNIFLLKMIEMFKTLDPKQSPLYIKLKIIFVRE